MVIRRDFNYVLIETVQRYPRPIDILVKSREKVTLTKGVQCGECGLRLEYDDVYGFTCERGKVCPVTNSGAPREDKVD